MPLPRAKEHLMTNVWWPRTTVKIENFIDVWLPLTGLLVKRRTCEKGFINNLAMSIKTPKKIFALVVVTWRFREFIFVIRATEVHWNMIRVDLASTLPDSATEQLRKLKDCELYFTKTIAYMQRKRGSCLETLKNVGLRTNTQPKVTRHN